MKDLRRDGAIRHLNLSPDAPEMVRRFHCGKKGGALHFQESQGMGLKRPSAAPCHKFPDLSVGLVAQIVFYLAGILRGGGLGDAQKHKKLGNGLMAVINAAGNGHACFR